MPDITVLGIDDRAGTGQISRYALSLTLEAPRLVADAMAAVVAELPDEPKTNWTAPNGADWTVFPQPLFDFGLGGGSVPQLGLVVSMNTRCYGVDFTGLIGRLEAALRAQYAAWFITQYNPAGGENLDVPVTAAIRWVQRTSAGSDVVHVPGRHLEVHNVYGVQN